MTTLSGKQSPLKAKHVPQRTCIGCREIKPKKELIRIVRSEDGAIAADPTGRIPGRGCYLCKSTSCWDSALKKEQLDRALRTRVTSEDKSTLIRQLESFIG